MNTEIRPKPELPFRPKERWNFFYGHESVGIQRLEKIRSDIGLELAAKVFKGKGLTEEEFALIEDGKF